MAVLTGKTRVLGLIADPVVQARSPDMANALLQQRNQLGAFVLVPMQVASNGIVEFTHALGLLNNFGGAIVSMPHKTRMVELVDELTPEAKLAGAVNVIRRTVDGKLIGTLLDGEGFVGGLLSKGHAVNNASCLLAGAGGAASAIAFALAKHGCKALAIINRTRTKAETLAAKVRAAYPTLEVSTDMPAAGRFDIAINATSLGMKAGDELPFPMEIVARCSLVAECVIAPEMTQLLQIAQTHGCAIHTGVPMLEAQMSMMLDFMCQL